MAATEAEPGASLGPVIDASFVSVAWRSRHCTSSTCFVGLICFSSIGSWNQCCNQCLLVYASRALYLSVALRHVFLDLKLQSHLGFKTHRNIEAAINLHAPQTGIFATPFSVLKTSVIPIAEPLYKRHPLHEKQGSR